MKEGYTIKNQEKPSSQVDAAAFHENFQRFDDIKDESILAGAPRK